MLYNVSMSTATYSTYEIRVRAVKAVLRGMALAEVARAYQIHRSSLHRWVRRYREGGGENGLSRKPGSGRPRLLEALDKDALVALVLEPASAFGFETDFWTCRRLQDVIVQEFGVSLSKWTVWRRLRDAGLTYQKPERRYFEASENLRLDWVTKELPRIRRAVRRYRAILYFQDESNISLTALLGKTWAPCGRRPTQRVTGSRASLSAVSAITGQGGLLFRLFDKRIASDEIISFLEQMLRHHRRRHLVVVMDRASPHVSKKTRAFVKKQRRLHTFYLPPYSPDWNPDEQVWNHLKHQELKAHQARTKDEMKHLALEKLGHMAQDKSKLRGIFFRCCIADLLQ